MARFYLCLSVFICGCLLLPAQGRLYVANSEGDDLTVIDTKTFKVVDSIKVGRNPHGMAYSPASRLLYVTTEHDNKLLKVDPWTGKIVSSADVGITPNEPAVTKDGRFVYVPLRGEDALHIVDTQRMKAVKKIPLERWPHNAYTGADGSMYVTAFMGGMIHVYNPTSHEQLYQIAFPGEEVRPLAITRDQKTIYTALSRLHGFVVADAAQRKEVRRVKLPDLPAGTPRPFLDTYTHGLALTPDEKELWVTSCAGDKMYVFSAPDLKQLASVDVGKFPNWVSFRPDGKILFVSNQGASTVSAIDVAARRVVATMPTGKAPKRLLAIER